MLETLSWWLLVDLIGIAVFPIAFRFFRNLPDRGYAFIKPLGLLLIAYPYWLFTSLGFLANTRGGSRGRDHRCRALLVLWLEAADKLSIYFWSCLAAPKSLLRYRG